MKLHTARSSVSLYHRWMALLLVAVMILSVLPLSALTVSAEENDGSMPPTGETSSTEPANESNEPPEGTTAPTDVLEVVTSPTTQVKASSPRASNGQEGLIFNKTVTANGDGTYTLELTLQGNPSELKNPAKLDLIIIIDRSNSMAYQDSSTPRNRLTKAKEAANALIDVINANSAIDANYRIMDFSGSGHSPEIDQKVASYSKWTKQDTYGPYKVVNYSGWYKDNQAASAKNRVNAIKVVSRKVYSKYGADGYGSPLEGSTALFGKDEYALRSTNYEAVFQTIREQNLTANSGRNDAMKVIVFLTDGNPTVTWSYLGAGTYGYEGYGTTYDSDSKNVTACLNKAKAQIKYISADRIYAIGFGDITDVGNLQSLVNEASKISYKAPAKLSSESNLTTDMKKIGYEIEKLFYSNITITDTLRHEGGLKLVDVSPDAKLTITVTGNGDPQTSDTGTLVLKSTSTNSGNEASRTLKVSRSGDNLILDFPDTYKLESGLTYKLSTIIEPTEAAYRKYRANEEAYKDTPGANTGTHASKNELGIYSNDEAIATYTYNDTTGNKVVYPHPVFQLTPGKLIINKTITGWDTMTDAEKAALKESMTFNVTLTYPDDGNGVDDEKKTISFTLAQMTDNKDGTFTYAPITGLSPNTAYTVTESGGEVDGYKMATTVNGETANAEKSASGTVAKGATVTVSYQNSYEIAITNVRIEKQVTGNMGSWEKDFTFTASLSGTASSLKGLTYIKYSKNENGELVAGSSTEITEDSHTFTLKDNEYIVFFRVPLGALLTVTEALDGYVLMRVVDQTDQALAKDPVDDNHESVSLILSNPKLGEEVGHSLTFTNDKTVTIETGIVLDSLPYVMVLVGVAAAAMFLFLRKPRNFED